MKKFALIALAVATMSANAATYTIDEHHTAARFSIDHMGTSTNHGGFYGLTGQVEFDPAAKTGFIGITIPIVSLDTGIKAFTEHLKSDDFFDVKAHPTAYFKSTQWHFKGNKVTGVDGELTLKGQTHPVTLTATKFNCYQNPMLQAESCGGDFSVTIDRTKWGIDKYVDMGVAKEVTLNIQVEAFNKDRFKAENTETKTVSEQVADTAKQATNAVKKTSKKAVNSIKKAVKKVTKK